MKHFYYNLYCCLLGILLFMFSYDLNAQVFERWSVNPGIDNIKFQGKLFSSPDDYLMFVGSGYYTPALDSGSVAVVKMDHDGTILNHEEYSIFGLPILYDVIQVPGGYITTGKLDAGVQQAYIMMIGDDLSLNWVKGPQSSYLTNEQFGTVVLADGQLHVFASSNPGQKEAYKLTMDENADNWGVMAATIVDSSQVRIFDAVSTAVAGEFLAGGQVRDTTDLYTEALILLYNPAGVAWSKRVHFGEGDFGNVAGIKESADGNYFVTIRNFDSSTSINTAYIAKMTTAGDVIWSKSYSRPDANVLLSAPYEMDSGDLLVTGIEGNNQLANLIKLNADGELIWAKSWSPEELGNGGIMDLLKMSDGSFRMLTGGDNIGVTELDATGNGCGFIPTTPIDVSEYTLNTSSNAFTSIDSLETAGDMFDFDRAWNYTSQQECSIVLGLEEEELHTSLILVPNPASSGIRIQGLDPQDKWSYELLDMNGRRLQFGTYNDMIDLSSLDVGPYVIRIDNGSLTRHLKVLKLE